MNEIVATIDFETRNVTNDKLLFQVGAFNYSRHPKYKDIVFGVQASW